MGIHIFLSKILGVPVIKYIRIDLILYLSNKSSVLAAASASSSSPLKQYRRKTSAGKVQMLETLEEVSFQSSYLLTIFLPFFSFSFLLCLHFF